VREHLGAELPAHHQEGACHLSSAGAELASVQSAAPNGGLEMTSIG
jgi:hypothetical protein